MKIIIFISFIFILCPKDFDPLVRIHLYLFFRNGNVRFGRKCRPAGEGFRDRSELRNGYREIRVNP